MSFATYMKEPYTKEWNTTISSVTEGKFVTLEKTYFYPTSGGQPHDTGTLTKKNGEKINVIFVGKFSGKVSHQVTPENKLEEGEEITCEINWERRHKLMRMHTAAHIISNIFESKKGAVITGNQLGEEKSRIDYQLEDYNPEELRSFEKEVNDIIAEELPVTSHFLTREEAEEKLERMSTLKIGFPPEIKEVRVLEIGDKDAQACGGTHVANTKEIGQVTFLKFDNKGKNNRRVYYTLE